MHHSVSGGVKTSSLVLGVVMVCAVLALSSTADAEPWRVMQ